MLNQRLASYMWWGVAINIVAMVLVSVTNFVEPGEAQPDGANNPGLGALFILMSCVVQARAVEMRVTEGAERGGVVRLRYPRCRSA